MPEIRDFADLAGLVMRKVIENGLNGVAERSIVEYRNIWHLMKKDVEVQKPHKNETYTFMLNDGWRVVEYHKDYITVSKTS